MSGLEPVLAAFQGADTVLELAEAVIKSVSKVYKFFVRIENAPSSLQQFDYKIQTFKLHFGNYSSVLRKLDQPLPGFQLKAIQITLNDCNKFLDKFQAVTDPLWTVRGGLRTVWLAVDDTEIENLTHRINSHLFDVILPGLNAILAGPRQPETESIYSVPEEEIDGLFRRFQDIQSEHVRNESREEIERTLRALERELRRFWRAQDIPEVDVFDGLPIEHRRRSSVAFEDVPTIMHLDFVDENTRHLKHLQLSLRYLSITARDTVSRMLQYQEGQPGNTFLTQIVPYGTIPWTNPLRPLEVSFLKNHMVTVKADGGYELYSVDPVYKFQTERACERFQSIFRERELLASVQTVEIRERVHKAWRQFCTRQIVKIWRRRDGETFVTMTFLATSRGHENPVPHEEIDLNLFSEVVKETKLNGKPAVELYRLAENLGVRVEGNLVISFVNSTDLARFKSRFSTYHPKSILLQHPPSSSSSTTLELTPSGSSAG
ncbi:hypothetical protein GQ53DRAFT_815338 [Thozetella sp. PMI_491]|nr:hypothetical protein GQ53DRAFT_815338 [Thozetella sp. PMI_491]